MAKFWPIAVPLPRAEEGTYLRLDGAYGPRFAGEILAQVRGYLGKGRNLVTVQSVLHDEAFVHNVVRDRAIGVTTGQKFLLSAWRGEPIVTFGASFLDTPIVVVTLEQSGLRYPSSLVGKRIAYESNTEEGVVFEALVTQLGLARSRIERVSVDDKYDALRRGKIDAIVANIDDPQLWIGELPQKFNIIKLQDYGIHIPGLVYFASADLVRSRPSLISDTLKAILLGWHGVYADIDQATAAIAAFDKAELRTSYVNGALRLQRDLVRPTGSRVGDFDPSRWNTIRDVLLFARLGQETVALSALVNYDFVREVYRRSSSPAAGELQQGAGD